jgi:hypothetical protein
MAIQQFGSRIEEKKETPKKKSKWRKPSTIFNVLFIIITLISVTTSGYFSIRNQEMQDSLYNYTPFIFSNQSSPSTLKNIFFEPDTSYITLVGLVEVDLRIVTPCDGMLTIEVKRLELYNATENNSAINFFNASMIQYSSTLYFTNRNYQYWMSKYVMNPINDKLSVQVNLYLNSGVLQETFKPSGSIEGIGFYLGELNFHATIYEAQLNKNYTQDFKVGVQCEISKYV